MGFCFFNNVAIAARYLQKQHAIERIVVIDWDVHHGNGTQYMFDKDQTIYFVSLHQDPSSCYPGTGKGSEIGYGQGKGFTRNFPMPAGAGEEEYLKALEKVEQAMEKFRPQFVLISAGFDAHVQRVGLSPCLRVATTLRHWQSRLRNIYGFSWKGKTGSSFGPKGVSHGHLNKKNFAGNRWFGSGFRSGALC
jgi:acetoin utilization deacetylase AcuC-like enzyme